MSHVIAKSTKMEMSEDHANRFTEHARYSSGSAFSAMSSMYRHCSISHPAPCTRPQIKPPCNPSFQARRNEPEAIPFSSSRLNFGEIFVTCMSHHPSIHPQSSHLATTFKTFHRWRINVPRPRTKANPSSASHKIIISLEQ